MYNLRFSTFFTLKDLIKKPLNSDGRTTSANTLRNNFLNFLLEMRTIKPQQELCISKAFLRKYKYNKETLKHGNSDLLDETY